MDKKIIVNFAMIGLLVPVFVCLLFKKHKPKLSVIPTMKNKPLVTQSGPYLDNNGSNLDNSARQNMERLIGKNWYAPPDQPGVLYGQLPDGHILIRYYDQQGHTTA